MLEDFLLRQDINFTLLQKVTHTKLDTFRRYTAYVNGGTDNSGTAILAKVGLTLYNIKRIPPRRGISAMFNGLWIINVYASSGALKRKEREEFFNVDVTHLIPPNNTEMILAGDFHCVL